MYNPIVVNYDLRVSDALESRNTLSETQGGVQVKIKAGMLVLFLLGLEFEEILFFWLGKTSAIFWVQNLSKSYFFGWVRLLQFFRLVKILSFFLGGEGGGGSKSKIVITFLKSERR